MADVVEKENIFLFIPNLIGMYWNQFFQCFSKLRHRVSSIDFTIFPWLTTIVDLIFSGYARIVLAVISFYFMQTNYIVAGWCYIISALLDAIDGHAARAFNQSEYKLFNYDLKPNAVNLIKLRWLFLFLCRWVF